MAARLFHIPELCTCIAEAVPDCAEESSRSAQQTKQTLARLAQISKTFKEPALNALWRDMPDFSPIALLLPDDFVTISRGPRGQRRMNLVKRRPAKYRLKIDPEARAAVLSYTRRVRSISWVESGDISLPLVEFIATLGSPTFPLLRELAWEASLAVDFALLKPLLSTSLHTLLLTCQDAFSDPTLPELAHIMNVLPQSTPRLRCLHLCGGLVSVQSDTKAALGASLRCHLGKLQSLETFSAPGFPIAIQLLPQLSSLSYLKVIYIEFSDDSPCVPIWSSDSFPSLVEANIRGLIHICTDFVQSLREVAPMRLRTLNGHLTNSALDPMSTLRFAEAVHDVLSTSLRALTVVSTPLDPTALLPIFSCRLLTSLEIPIQTEASRSQALMQAHETWPKIERLNFAPDLGWCSEAEEEEAGAFQDIFHSPYGYMQLVY